MNEILNRLKKEGWVINELKFTNLIRNDELQINYSDIKNFLLNNDIKHYGDSWMNTSSKSEFNCSGVFQINKIRNVAAPDVDQDNKNSPSLLKFTITDGVSTIHLLDLQSNPKLNRNNELGCKVLINGQTMFKSGMVILLDRINVTILGGKVMELIRSENINKTSKMNRLASHGASQGPPKFTPFGNKLNINMQEIRKFKAMQTETTKENTINDNSEFGDKREAALAEIRKTKDGDASFVTDKHSLLDKFHGGGTSKFIKETTEKQDQKDSNVAYLMSSGFNFTEVQRALKASNNDVNVALDHLLQKRVHSQLDISEKEFRGRGKRGRGKSRENNEEDDSWFDPVKYAAQVGLATRPNNTISLAELMGSKPTSETKSYSDNSNFNLNMIHRGFKCLAEVMDGSYQQAVVVDILPHKCLKIQYVNSGEMIETNVTSLKMLTGEKVFEHMIPNVPDHQSERNSASYGGDYHNNNNNYRGGSGYRGRGQGNSNRRRGRFHRGY